MVLVDAGCNERRFGRSDSNILATAELTRRFESTVSRLLLSARDVLSRDQIVENFIQTLALN